MAALGKQPTPCLCLALLFALLHSVTFGCKQQFAAAHESLSTATGANPPAPLRSPDRDAGTGKLTICTTGVFRLAS